MLITNSWRDDSSTVSIYCSSRGPLLLSLPPPRMLGSLVKGRFLVAIQIELLMVWKSKRTGTDCSKTQSIDTDWMF